MKSPTEKKMRNGEEEVEVKMIVADRCDEY
jgi:hypothetical protein